LRRLKKYTVRLIILSFLIIGISYCYEYYKHIEFNNYIESDSYYHLDHKTGHFHSPNTIKTIVWKEHKSGNLVLKTNNLGLRNEASTEVKKSIKRVLITGDSHTDGLVYNQENFVSRLNQLDSNKTEFLNAGHGFYSFKNYRQTIQKLGYLKPDIFVITVYTGNDFIENLLYSELNIDFPNNLIFSWFRIKRKLMPRESSQHLNQALFFDLNPDLIDHSLDIAIKELMTTEEYCIRHNIDFKVLILPSEISIDDKIINQLEKDGVSKEIISKNQIIAKKFTLRLKNNKIKFYNLLQDFKNSSEDLFWDSDSHLNVAGHKLVAHKTKEFILH